MGKKDKKIKDKHLEPGSIPFTRAFAQQAVETVRRFADPLCRADGLELVHIEFLRGPGGRMLKIVVDKPGGVTLDDCVSVSRQVSDFLDVSLEDIGPYNLEVSSPGPERPLGRLDDFARFEGRTAKISTFQPLEGRKNFTGTLDGVSGETVCLRIDEKTIRIPLQDIRRAHLVDGES